MKNNILKSIAIVFVVGLFSTFVLSCDGSSGDGGGGGNCERVTALAEGYGDIEIHNDLNSGVSAFFPELAFEALIRPGKCEIYGVPDGSRELELTQCDFASDSECNAFGNTQFLTIPVEEGGKEVIFVGDYF